MTRYFDDLDEAVVVDVETTGLSPETDRIISVSLLRVCFATLDRQTNSHRLEGDTLDTTVNPQRPIPADATRVHGVTNADVADAGPFAEAAQQIRDFIGTRPIVAHNAAFDKAFLSAEFKRAGVKTLHRNRSYCTMQRYQAMQDGRRKGSTLEEVAHYFGIPGRRSAVHQASEDVQITCAIAGMFYLIDQELADRAYDPEEWYDPEESSASPAPGVFSFPEEFSPVSSSLTPALVMVTGAREQQKVPSSDV
ncbi:MAG: 3'-5' exonuclease [Desulfurellaceae bacterium]|nr:3'-5' exonuclease [Desulfurellaceae bacterium]